MKLVLPELLLLCPIQERKVPNMMHEHIPQKRQLRIPRRHLTDIRAKGRAEPLQSSWRGELGDFILGLLGDELSLEIWRIVSQLQGGKSRRPYRSSLLTMFLLSRQNCSILGLTSLLCKANIGWPGVVRYRGLGREYKGVSSHRVDGSSPRDAVKPLV